MHLHHAVKFMRPDTGCTCQTRHPWHISLMAYCQLLEQWYDVSSTRKLNQKGELNWPPSLQPHPHHPQSTKMQSQQTLTPNAPSAAIPNTMWAVLPLVESVTIVTALDTSPYSAGSPGTTDILRTFTTDHPQTAGPGPRGPVTIGS